MLTTMWNELNVYRPHTIDAEVLLKRAEGDKIFQLLASLSSDFEDLRSHILMNVDLPSFSSICATIQREEIRRKVMNMEVKSNLLETRAYASNYKSIKEMSYKGKRGDLKCSYCNNGGHSRDRCWILHPELKPKFLRDHKAPLKAAYGSPHKANLAASDLVASVTLDEMLKFTANPVTLINEFFTFIHKKQGVRDGEEGSSNQTALLGHFAGFLAENKNIASEDIPGILKSFSTTLLVSSAHDYWIVDSGASDHMTNKVTNLHNFETISAPSHVSVANGKGASVLGKGKINLMSNNVESNALYVPSFPFQLLSVGQLTNSLKCLAIFSPCNVVFQDLVSKKKIGEGFYVNGLYYVSREIQVPKAFQGEHLMDLFPMPHLGPIEHDVLEHLPSQVAHIIQEELDEQEISLALEHSPSPNDTIPSIMAPTLQPANQARRNPSQQRNPPPRLHDYVTYNAKYPLTSVLDYEKFLSNHAAFLTAITNAHEPQTFDEANLHDEWRRAMEEELEALHNNHT
ncbi:hypothetical protein ACFX19_004061 [Malus domestica]